MSEVEECAAKVADYFTGWSYICGDCSFMAGGKVLTVRSSFYDKSIGNGAEVIGAFQEMMKRLRALKDAVKAERNFQRQPSNEHESAD